MWLVGSERPSGCLHNGEYYSMILCGCCAELRSWSEPTANTASLILHENFGLSDSIGCRHAGCIEWNTGRGKPNDEMYSSIDVRDQRGIVIGPGRALKFDTREKAKVKPRGRRWWRKLFSSIVQFGNVDRNEMFHLTITDIFS